MFGLLDCLDVCRYAAGAVVDCGWWGLTMRAHVILLIHVYIVDWRLAKDRLARQSKK